MELQPTHEEKDMCLEDRIATIVSEASRIETKARDLEHVMWELARWLFGKERSQVVVRAYESTSSDAGALDKIDVSLSNIEKALDNILDILKIGVRDIPAE